MGIRALVRGIAVLAVLAPPAVADPAEPLLPVDVLSRLAGFPLVETQQASDAPNTQITDTAPDSCRTVYNSGTALVYGDDYASYQSEIDSDGVHRLTDEQSPHTASQSVAVYPTAQDAAAAFGRLAEGVRSCAAQTFVAHEPDGDIVWRFDRAQVQPDRVRWYSRQDGYEAWPCANDHRLHGRSIVSATICQVVHAESPAEAQAVDARLDRITAALAARTD
ncbi:MAG: sensor domain-containing protein [Segniliparus sp.]|uniref:sensor domain-containing protein n=1 Tax=Segniliparus sp. TaxID=2804064 RepID=UPI003F2BE5AC